MDSPPPPPPSSSSDMQPNVAAGIAFLILGIGGLVFLFIEKKNQWVRFWAAQSLVVGIGILAVGIVFWILAHIPFLVFLLFPLSILLWLGSLALAVWGAIQAFGNKTWEIPVVAPYARILMTKIGV